MQPFYCSCADALLVFQRMSTVSRTNIETGIYFRWDDPDDDSAASSLSTLNDARLGSYVYEDDASGPVVNSSVTSGDDGTERGVDDSSTDRNNNELSLASDRRASLSSQHGASAAPSRNCQTLVNYPFRIHHHRRHHRRV